MLRNLARWVSRRYATRLTPQGNPRALARLREGEAHAAMGRNDEAAKWLRDAVRLDAGLASAWLRLGHVCFRLGELDESVRALETSLALDPRQVEAHFQLGAAHSALGGHDAAIASYQRALALNPDFAGAHNNLGAAFNDAHRNEEAIASCGRALALKPDFAEAHNNLGAALIALNRHDAAIASFERVLAIMPANVGAHYNLGAAYYALGDHAQAIASFARAVALQPESAEARWAYAMCQMPRMFVAKDGSAAARAAFGRELADLSRWFASNQASGAEMAVGTAMPFYLAYQELSNRDLLSRYGDLCAQVLQRWWDGAGLSPRDRDPRGTIRIGIVSAHVKDQSVWNAIVRGWVSDLARGRFELIVFHMALEHDQETAYAKARAAYLCLGGKSLHECVAGILDRQPDILVYPEIGMDPMTSRLASLRLAPIQAASWGHPETSGLPTIDYYLSAEDMEPAQAQENYRETLVLLPHLGCCYRPFTDEPVTQDLARLGVDTARPLLLCAGAPFKYVAEHDAVLVAIARELGRCQFIFFIDAVTPALSAKLQRRLESAFAQAGLEFNDCVIFIAFQTRPLFYDLMRRATVFLDTIGFSGFNTAIQAVECALPVVTREGRFLRGRLASGILRRMGLTELIAASEQEYIELAVKVARDAAYRQELRARIEASRHLLFGDLAPIRALEEFFIDAYQKRRGSRP